MPRLLISAGRRGLAAVVLFFAGIAAVDAALFKVWHPAYPPELGGKAVAPKVIQQLEAHRQVDCSISACYSTSPNWTIPVAIVVGLTGALIAALIYRPRTVARRQCATP